MRLDLAGLEFIVANTLPEKLKEVLNYPQISEDNQKQETDLEFLWRSYSDILEKNIEFMKIITIYLKCQVSIDFKPVDAPNILMSLAVRAAAASTNQTAFVSLRPLVIEMFKHIINHPEADTDFINTTYQGQTTLMHLARLNDYELVKSALLKDARIDSKDYAGKAVIDYVPGVECKQEDPNRVARVKKLFTLLSLTGIQQVWNHKDITKKDKALIISVFENKLSNADIGEFGSFKTISELGKFLFKTFDQEAAIKILLLGESLGDFDSKIQLALVYSRLQNPQWHDCLKRWHECWAKAPHDKTLLEILENFVNYDGDDLDKDSALQEKQDHAKRQLVSIYSQRFSDGSYSDKPTSMLLYESYQSISFDSSKVLDLLKGVTKVVDAKGIDEICDQINNELKDSDFKECKDLALGLVCGAVWHKVADSNAIIKLLPESKTAFSKIYAEAIQLGMVSMRKQCFRLVGASYEFPNERNALEYALGIDQLDSVKYFLIEKLTNRRIELNVTYLSHRFLKLFNHFKEKYPQLLITDKLLDIFTEAAEDIKAYQEIIKKQNFYEVGVYFKENDSNKAHQWFQLGLENKCLFCCAHLGITGARSVNFAKRRESLDLLINTSSSAAFNSNELAPQVFQAIIHMAKSELDNESKGSDLKDQANLGERARQYLYNYYSKKLNFNQFSSDGRMHEGGAYQYYQSLKQRKTVADLDLFHSYLVGEKYQNAFEILQKVKDDGLSQLLMVLVGFLRNSEPHAGLGCIRVLENQALELIGNQKNSPVLMAMKVIEERSILGYGNELSIWTDLNKSNYEQDFEITKDVQDTSQDSKALSKAGKPQTEVEKLQNETQRLVNSYSKVDDFRTGNKAAWHVFFLTTLRLTYNQYIAKANNQVSNETRLEVGHCFLNAARVLPHVRLRNYYAEFAAKLVARDIEQASILLDKTSEALAFKHLEEEAQQYLLYLEQKLILNDLSSAAMLGYFKHLISLILQIHNVGLLVECVELFVNFLTKNKDLQLASEWYQVLDSNLWQLSEWLNAIQYENYLDIKLRSLQASLLVLTSTDYHFNEKLKRLKEVRALSPSADKKDEKSREDKITIALEQIKHDDLLSLNWLLENYHEPKGFAGQKLRTRKKLMCAALAIITRIVSQNYGADFPIDFMDIKNPKNKEARYIHDVSKSTDDNIKIAYRSMAYSLQNLLTLLNGDRYLIKQLNASALNNSSLILIHLVKIYRGVKLDPKIADLINESHKRLIKSDALYAQWVIRESNTIFKPLDTIQPYRKINSVIQKAVRMKPLSESGEVKIANGEQQTSASTVTPPSSNGQSALIALTAIQTQAAVNESQSSPTRTTSSVDDLKGIGWALSR